MRRRASVMIDENGRLMQVGLGQPLLASEKEVADEGSEGGDEGAQQWQQQQEQLGEQPQNGNGVEAMVRRGFVSGKGYGIQLPGAVLDHGGGSVADAGDADAAADDEGEGEDEGPSRQDEGGRLRRSLQRKPSKRKIRVRTTIAGFALAKGAAKRLAKNQYERRRALKKRHSGDLSAVAGYQDGSSAAVEASDPYDYLGN